MADKTFVLKNSTSLTQQVFCWDDDVDFTSGTAWTASLSDTITLSDAKVLGIGLVKSDTITLSDAISHAFTKVLADIVTLSDAISNAVGKALADTVNLSDAISNAVGKVVSDTISLSDSLTTSLARFLYLADTITMSDAISFLSDLLQEIPELIATTLRKTFGITRPDKPSGMTRHTDKTDIV